MAAPPAGALPRSRASPRVQPGKVARGNGRLGEILKEPDTPWVAFLKGAGWMAVGAGSSIFVGILLLHKSGDYELWTRLRIAGALVGIACVMAGVARAIWALVQRWAYDRVAGDPFH